MYNYFCLPCKKKSNVLLKGRQMGRTYWLYRELQLLHSYHNDCSQGTSMEHFPTPRVQKQFSVLCTGSKHVYV